MRRSKSSTREPLAATTLPTAARGPRQRMPMPRLLRALVLLTPTLWLLSLASSAHADIRQSQSHPDIEISPHLVLQCDDEPAWDDDGIGLGLHAGIPVIPQGPITTINNSLVIGFGLDWAHFDDACGPFALNPDDDCSANDFWLPVYVEWNFFFSELISAFPELGMAIEYETWDAVVCGGNPNRNFYWCGGDGDDID